MLDFFVKIFKSLNSNSHPGEIAHALSIGVIMGCMPKDTVLWYILFIFFLFFRIHKGAFFLTALSVSFIAGFADPLFDKLGYAVLTAQPLQGIFTALLDIPLFAFTKINNTIVMGSLLGSLILYIPVYSITIILVRVWRVRLAPAFSQSKFMHIIYKVPFIKKIVNILTKQEFI